MSKLSDSDWHQLLTDGSDLNKKWKARLDIIARFIQQLKDARLRCSFDRTTK